MPHQHQAKGRKYQRREKTPAGTANSDQLENDQLEDDDDDVVMAAGGTDADDSDGEDLLNMEVPPPPEAPMQEGGHRMIIHHIEVENFKSYFGTQIIGPFHKSFTSIIGPNGSGKSNVIDALLFVFGYRASKIRSKKISVLIHSSAGRENVQSCTVTVHFCKIRDINETEYEKIDGTDIAVSRTAYKDNTSKYAMNGRTVKFKEISELLQRNGIDLVHNRFLILQGEVEQISMMAPKAEKEDDCGMLEYLEDIIGSSRLKEPICKLAKRIEKIDDRRGIQLQRLHHAEKEKQQLEGPARELLAQMRLENRISRLTHRILTIKKHSLDANLCEKKSQYENMEKESSETKRKLAEVVNKSKQLSKEKQKLQNQLDKCQDDVQSTEREIGEQKQQKTKSDNDTKRLESRKEKLKVEIAAEKEKLAEWESAPEKAQKLIEEYRQQKAEAEAVIEECSPILLQKLDEAQKQMTGEYSAKAELEKQLSEVTAIEDELNSKLTLAQQKLINLRKEEDDERKKYDDLRNKISDTEEEIENQEKNFRSNTEQLPELEQTYEGKLSRMEGLRQRETNLAARVRELRQQLAMKSQAEEQLKGANKVLNQLMAAKQSGELNGIYGRLGDLGGIDQKYDVAISTTCGALDNIVVEDTETAQRCVEFLKRNELGVATFLALDKQQGFWEQIHQKPKTPENAPRLFDLINVTDEKILPAFYFAVRDTLVADEIAAATRIGLNSGRRWRTITLKGEIVDASGAMTGGGNNPTRGKMGRNVRVDTSQRRTEEPSIVELQQQLNNAQAELDGLGRECSQLGPELEHRLKYLDKLRMTLRDAEEDRTRLANRLKTFQAQIETQKRKVIEASANPEELRKAEKEMESIRAESGKLGEKTDKLRAKVMELNDRIEETNDRIAGPYQKRIKEAETKKEEAEKGITAENTKKSSSERNVKKCKDKLKNLEHDIKGVERQLEASMERSSDAQNRIGELDEILSQRRDELETAKAELTGFMDSIGERNVEEVELGNRVDELKRELKKMDTEIAQIETKLKSINTKLSALKLYRTKRLANTLAKSPEANLMDPPQHRDTDDEEEEDDEEKDSDRPVEDGENEEADKDDEVEQRMEVDEAEAEEEDEEDIDDGENNDEFFMPMPKLNEQALQAKDVEQLEQELAELQDDGKLNVNLNTLRDYMTKATRYETEFNALAAVTEKRDKHRAFHDQLKKRRLCEFMDGFQQIATELRITYQMITIQGDVSLELVDSLDPFAEGIAFNVRPPKKSWKQITNLSGGEKTLASLSLVFGLHKYKPTPLYVMDEIDAALDFRNVSIIANYLLERTRNAQFVVISLRNQMFEKADRLIGIYKVRDCTSNIVVDPRELNRAYKKDCQTLKRVSKSTENSMYLVGSAITDK